MYVDYDHGLAVMWFSLHLDSRRRKPQTQFAEQRLSNLGVRTSYEKKPSDELGTLKNSNADEHRDRTKR